MNHFRARVLLLKILSFKLQFWGQILTTENIPGKACVSCTQLPPNTFPQDPVLSAF